MSARDISPGRSENHSMNGENTATRPDDTPELISPDPILTSGPNDLCEVTVDERWRPLIEDVCILKEALDHATQLGITNENDEWVETVFKAHGLSTRHFAKACPSDGPQMPMEFMRILLGTWFFEHSRTCQDEDVLVTKASLPPWATVGWVRKTNYRKTLNLPPVQLIAAVQLSYTHSAETIGYFGTPFFLASEGKNRTQLHRLANAPRLSKLLMRKAPPFNELTLRPVPFVSWGVALEHPQRRTEILPFGTLSKRLLLALGATWDDRPYFKGIQALRETCAVRRLVAPSWPEFAKLPKNDHAIRLLLIGGKRLMDACGPK
jgi:hypothetical protein